MALNQDEQQHKDYQLAVNVRIEQLPDIDMEAFMTITANKNMKQPSHLKPTQQETTEDELNYTINDRHEA
eukprot:5777927-Heterocapsa_arctica.AAC.1